LRKHMFESLSWPLFILLVLVTVNFIRGAAEFGLKPAGNGIRDIAYLIVPSIILQVVRPVLVLQPREMAKWLVWIGSGFMILAASRWVGVLPTPQDLIESSSGFREVVRVIPSDQAMVVGQALMAILFLQVTRGIRWWGAILATLLGVTTIALQHRSVWSSVLLGLTWLAVRTIGRYPKGWLKLTVGVLIAVMIAGAALMATGRLDSVVSLVKVNVDETQQADSTWDWRVQGFADATDRALSGDLFETIVGPPSGNDLSNDLSATASFASVHIHNRYVSVLAYYGLFGVASLLWWLLLVAKKVGGWVRSAQGGCGCWAGQAFLQALLVSQLTYFVAYAGGLLQGVLLAMISLASVYCSVSPSTSREVSYPAQLRTPAIQ
jgi:hypothetical protein